MSLRTQVRVMVAWQSATVTAARWRVEIADNGVGLDPSAAYPGQYGLRHPEAGRVDRDATGPAQPPRRRHTDRLEFDA